MPPDPGALVGQLYGPGEYTLEPWVAHCWAAATRDDPDQYRRSRGEGGQLAPPTLAQVVAREAAGTGDIEAELRGGDWDDLSVFLGGQRCSFQQPLRAGETYRATAEVTGVTRKEGTSGPFQVLTVAYVVETSGGDPAFELETDIVVREAREPPRSEGTLSDHSFEPGEVVGRRVVDDVDPADMRTVAAIVGDPNPLHYDRAYATDHGFEGRANQGPANAAYALQAALEIAESPAALRSFDVRYEGFVVEGDTVTATAAVEAVREPAGERLVDLALDLTTADGAVVLTGTGTVAVEGRP